MTEMSDHETREVSVNLPDDADTEVVGADVFVDGTRFAVPAAALTQP